MRRNLNSSRQKAHNYAKFKRYNFKFIKIRASCLTLIISSKFKRAKFFKIFYPRKTKNDRIKSQIY
ncbi:hypothetical protein CAMRE0001_3246 [Campylobacter rectus RM3267]|uniref:Uncharacterized protein n=1 Tax=Campylobacter rectus RM3267 TaxID=553218 RepID=B9D504_CAMRE|nr:hypothetical protein CAMRE0001_3246 [Campylobacter rectus RM3267]